MNVRECSECGTKYDADAERADCVVSVVERQRDELLEQCKVNGEKFKALGRVLTDLCPGAHVEHEHVVDTACRVIRGYVRLFRRGPSHTIGLLGSPTATVNSERDPRTMKPDGVQPYDDFIKYVVAELAAMPLSERVRFFQVLSRQICSYCGSDVQQSRCHCTRDD